MERSFAPTVTWKQMLNLVDFVQGWTEDGRAAQAWKAAQPGRINPKEGCERSFRHSFGTQTVASGVPLDVTQWVVGHASVRTTTVYVTAEQQRMRRELGAYFGKLDPPASHAVPISSPLRDHSLHRRLLTSPARSPGYRLRRSS